MAEGENRCRNGDNVCGCHHIHVIKYPYWPDDTADNAFCVDTLCLQRVKKAYLSVAAAISPALPGQATGVLLTNKFGFVDLTVSYLV